MKIKRLAAICAITAMLCAFYSSHFANSPQNQAKSVLTKLLNIPAPPIAQEYSINADNTGQSEPLPPSSDTVTAYSPDDTAIRNAYKEMFGDSVSDHFIKTCIQMNDLTSLHFCALQYGFTAEPTELSISKTSQNNILEYDAELLIHFEKGNEQTLSVTGKLVFDDDKKIDIITIGGADLRKFLIDPPANQMR